MKKYIGIVLLLLMLPAVAANLKVKDIRGYVNNERTLDINEAGGDFDVNPGNSIDLIIRLQNNANITIQAKLIGTIQNIDSNADITKTQDFFDISAGNDQSKTLSFIVPSNARADEFEMELRIINKFSNGTEVTISVVDYNVIVDKLIKADESSINDVLSNLSSSCNKIVDTTNTCFGYIGAANNCTSELSTVKEERGSYKQQSEEYSKTLESIKAENAELERQKINLDNQVEEMVTKVQCNNQTSVAIEAVRENNDDKFNQTLLFVGGGALIYWYYNKRKKDKSSVVNAYESDYYNKN